MLMTFDLISRSHDPIWVPPIICMSFRLAYDEKCSTFSTPYKMQLERVVSDVYYSAGCFQKVLANCKETTSIIVSKALPTVDQKSMQQRYKFSMHLIIFFTTYQQIRHTVKTIQSHSYKYYSYQCMAFT